MNKNFDEDDYHYMNNTNSASSNPKVIQIPVHHFKSSNTNETNSLPKTSTSGFDHGGLGQHDKQQHNQDFFNRNPNHQGIFDDFQSPFGKFILSCKNSFSLISIKTLVFACELFLCVCAHNVLFLLTL